MQNWVDSSPNSPIASGCLALACLHAGFAYRGTDWGHTVDENGWSKLEAFATRAREELSRTQAQHGGHWFWHKADLMLAIEDYSSYANHWERFQMALIAAPGSSDFYGTFAHQLMPRWYGHYGQLNDLCDQALSQDDAITGLHNYVAILQTLWPQEEDDCRELFRPAPLNALAEHYAAKNNDGDLTYAANLFAWADNWPAFLETMTRLNTFHQDRWICINSPEFTVAYALVASGVDTRKRA